MEVIIKNTIKYSLSSNIVALKDLLYDKSFIKCTKTGAICNTNCVFFKFDTCCKYAKYEYRYLTAGQLWYLLQISEDFILDERDFVCQIHTGKSLRPDKNKRLSGKGVATKRVRSNQSPTPIKKEKVDIDKKSLSDGAKNIVIKLTKEKTEKIIAGMEKVFDSNITVQEHVHNIYDIIKDDNKKFQNMKIVDFLNIISTYIDSDNAQIDLNDVKLIFEFLIFEYSPKSYDFPLDKTIDYDNIVSLIEKTSSYPDNHSSKWTLERYKLLDKEKDEYLRNIWYDDEYHSWFLYSIIGQQNRTFESITNVCIYTRYLFKSVLLKYTSYYGTTIICLNKIETPKIEKLLNVLCVLKDIYEQNSEFKISSLFIKEQLENTFQIITNRKEYDDVTYEYSHCKKIIGERVDGLKLFEILKEKQIVSKLKLFNGE